MQHTNIASNQEQHLTTPQLRYYFQDGDGKVVLLVPAYNVPAELIQVKHRGSDDLPRSNDRLVLVKPHDDNAHNQTENDNARSSIAKLHDRSQDHSKVKSAVKARLRKQSDIATPGAAEDHDTPNKKGALGRPLLPSATSATPTKKTAASADKRTAQSQGVHESPALVTASQGATSPKEPQSEMVTTGASEVSRAPISSKKRHDEELDPCKFWLRTGECNWMQRGCKFEHEIPPIEWLNAKGFKETPPWLLIELQRKGVSPHTINVDRGVSAKTLTALGIVGATSTKRARSHRTQSKSAITRKPSEGNLIDCEEPMPFLKQEALIPTPAPCTEHHSSSSGSARRQDESKRSSDRPSSVSGSSTPVTPTAHASKRKSGKRTRHRK